MRTHRAKSKLAVVKVNGSRMAPLKEVVHDDAALQEWLERLAALPTKEQNVVLRQNPEFAEILARRLMDGESILDALVVESNQDRVAAESTFLVTLKPYRDRLVREYDLKTAAELMLVDMVVLSYHQYLKAARTFFGYTAFGKSYAYETLVRYAQVYLARANELFLRNLEALRQMKAAPLTVKIAQAGQVNVGEKQVNVAGMPVPEAAEVVACAEPDEPGRAGGAAALPVVST